MDLRNNKALTPVESGYPITAITMDLTEHCNLACTYCFTNLSKDVYKPKVLNEEMGRKIIDWLIDPSTRGNFTTIDISFWGGEPLLEWELMQKLVLYGEEQARKSNITIGFGGTTNVTLLTPEKFDFIDKHKIQFLLSVDGTKEHHDCHRVFKDGRGSWDLVDKNINAIIQRWPDMQVRLSYSAENIETLLDDLKYLYSKGFKNIAYSPVCEDDWTEEKLAALNKTWDDIADWYAGIIRDGGKLYIKYINDGCKRMFSPDGNSAPCGAGRGYVGVTSEGAIYPCHRYHKFTDPRPWYEREMCLGNIEYGILNQSLRDNFTNWDTKTSLPESCKSCKSFEVNCTGGCTATNWDLFEDFSKNPQVQCETMLANMRIAERLFNELGPDFAARFKPYSKQISQIPMVQGCQCYNMHDDLYGRETINKNDRYSCLCNMATYGTQPKHIERCTCYNIEDDVITHYDMSGASCKQFTGEHNYEGSCSCKDPIQAAIEYIKNELPALKDLNEQRMEEIDKFAKLFEEYNLQKKISSELDNFDEPLEK